MKVVMVCLCALLIGGFAETGATAEAQHSIKPQYPAHPASSRPSYPTQTYPKPSNPSPAYPKPSHPAPSYPKPSYPAPAYRKPSHPAPAYPKPSYPTPAHAKPAYPALAHPTAPINSKPTYPELAYPAAYEKKYESQHHYCDPRKAPTCSNNGTQTVCFEDSEYPEKEVKYAIDYDPLVMNKYADVTDQSADDLVNGLTSLAEEHFDYSNYHGSFFEEGHWVGDEGYICPSDILYAHPVRAVNADGEWRVIVQDIAWPGYTQTQRIETCLFPGASCRTLSPCYQSECLQQYVYHRMLSFDPCDPQKGIFIDIYKLPSACSCHIRPQLG